MKRQLLELLICPKTKQKLHIEQEVESGVEIEDGYLVSVDMNQKYKIQEGVPRFVPLDNYSDNFGMQWNMYSKTQLDSYSGQTISADRFWNATGWDKDSLKDKWVLDVGCGSGRFTEIALSSGARVVALDYSSAVDACYKNFKDHANFHVVQGDIYELPFDIGLFSFVYCLGVLQHTPDPEKAFLSLPGVLKKNGNICVDYYEKSWKSALLPKYWLRPITKRLPKVFLFSMLKRITPSLLSISRIIGSVPVVGKVINRAVPVVNYYGIYPLSKQQHLEWSLLDTFDWLAPQYDNPQTRSTARLWMEKADLHNIEVLKAGHIVARGKK